MKFNTLQSERANFLCAYQGLIPGVIRLFSLLGGSLALLILLGATIGLSGPTLIGLSLIILAPCLAIWSFHGYVSYLRLHPEFLLTPAARQEPLNNFDYPAVRAIVSLETNKTYRAFWQALAEYGPLAAIIYRIGLTPALIGDLFDQTPTISEAERLTKTALAQRTKSIIDGFDLMILMLDHPAVAAYLKKQKLSSESVTALIKFHQARFELHRHNQFWLPENRGRSGGFAKLWAVSYTTLLDQFTTELGPEVALRAKYLPFYGRSNLVDQAITELNKANSQNVLLVGEPGIGKKELFYSLAARVLSYQTKTPLDGMQVRILNLQSLLAAASSPEELGPLFQALFNDIVRAGDVILFVSAIDLLLAPTGAGSVDVSNLLVDYIDDRRIHLIGTISPSSYVSLVRSRSLLADKFSPIEVGPPTGIDLENILFNNLPAIENRYRVFFPLQTVSQLISLAERYIKDSVSPKREIDLAEEVAAAVHARGGGLIMPDEVNAVVEQKVHVPLQVDEQEQQTLLNLEAELHHRIIGQNRAIKLVSDALLRARAGLTTGKKPIGSFLFLGPTGVGKTETAKALAKIYFGTDAKLVRLDMTEYADSRGLEKLLGTDGVKQPGSLTVAIQENPSSVVLFDEIEKASSTVCNILLQLLDEGRLTTNFGKVLDFTNTIVIATSNAGSDFIKLQVERGTNSASVEKQLLDQLIATRIFLPEFINRFDGVVVYLPLTKAEIKQVVMLQLAELTTLVHQQKGVELSIAPKVIEQLALKGYDPVFGARALSRVLKNELETVIARELISQKPAPGSTLTISSL